MSSDTPSEQDPAESHELPESPDVDSRGPAAHHPYQAAGRSSPWGYIFFAGILLLLSGLFWWWVEQETTAVLRIWMFAGLVATLSPLFWHIVDVLDAGRNWLARAT